LCLRKTRSKNDCGDVIVFEMFRFQNVLRPHKNARPAFSNCSGEKLSIFEKLRFRDRLG